MAEMDCSVVYVNLEEIGLPPGYRVGNDGTVWTCKNNRWGNNGKWRKLKGTLGTGKSKGVRYLTVKLGSPRLNYSIHFLVATAFHGPCPDGLLCRHLDGNSVNNRANNLSWGTFKENYADAVRHGTVPSGKPPWLPIRRGEDATGVKITENQARQAIEMLISGKNTVEIAAILAISQQTVSLIKRGDCWKHLCSKEERTILDGMVKRRKKAAKCDP